MFWENFLHGNEWYWRLLRTVVQGALGVIVAELDVIVGSFTVDPTLKPMIVAVIMAILSPIMAQLGSNVYEARVAREAAAAPAPQEEVYVDEKIMG